MTNRLPTCPTCGKECNTFSSTDWGDHVRKCADPSYITHEEAFGNASFPLLIAERDALLYQLLEVQKECIAARAALERFVIYHSSHVPSPELGSILDEARELLGN